MVDKVLEARISVVEAEVEGEKIVSRYILEQTRRNGADIATLKADMVVVKSDIAELKADVAMLKSDVSELKSDMRLLSRKFDDFQSSFPRIVAETMRDVMRGGGR